MGIVDKAKDAYNNTVKAGKDYIDHLKTEAQNIDAMNNATLTPENYLNTMLGNPKVLAEHLLHKKCISGTLTIPVRNYENQGASGKTVTIPFYLGSDISFSFGNNWKEAVNMESLNTLSSFLNTTSAVLGEAANVSMQSEAMSASVWQSSTFDGFSLDCLFVCTNRRFNTLKILNVLTATCLPTKYAQQPDIGNQGVGVIRDAANTGADIFTNVGNFVVTGIENTGKFFGQSWDLSKAKDSINAMGQSAHNYINDMGMIAPLNYGLRQGDSNANLEEPLPNSTVTLQIGDYFRADKLLVVSLSGVTLSKEVIGPPRGGTRAGDLYDGTSTSTDYGFPLYLKCQIKLKPHSMVHFTKWNSYFLKSQYKHDYPTASLKETTNNNTNTGGNT